MPGAAEDAGLRERLARFDDRHTIYRSDDPGHKIYWRRWFLSGALGKAVGVVLIAVLGLLIGETAGAIATLVIALVFLTAYLVWRRRRNRRMTGSATTWPR